MPELVLVEVDPVLGRAEPDEEVQDLLRASAGLNLGMDYLPGSLGFDPRRARGGRRRSPAGVLWLDALVGNVDRSWRNPNLLLWHRELQLIDHGATLVFHHDWSRAERARRAAVRRRRPRPGAAATGARRGRRRAGAAGHRASCSSEVAALVPGRVARGRAGLRRRPTRSARRTSTTCCAASPRARAWRP